MRPTTLGLSMTTIVKVTKIFGVDETAFHAMFRVEDKGGVLVIDQPIPPKAREAMRGDDRAFFEAHFQDKAWVINKRVPEQFW